MNPGCSITTEFEQTSGGYSIVITQDSDMIAITNKEAALKLADELRKWVDTLRTDEECFDRKVHDGYGWVVDRGCD